MFIERIYGSKQTHKTLYLLRIKLTPKTRWGQLYFHIFYQGDLDRTPHDHPWAFWTFPLTTYQEKFYLPPSRFGVIEIVRRFKWHYRSATHTHRVLSQPDNSKIITLIWHKPRERDWGFWIDGTWVHHEKYKDI